MFLDIILPDSPWLYKSIRKRDIYEAFILHDSDLSASDGGAVVKGILDGSIPKDKPLIILNADTITNVDVSKVGVSFRSKGGCVSVCKDGSGIPFSEAIAQDVLTDSAIEILVSLDRAYLNDLALKYNRTLDHL